MRQLFIGDVGGDVTRAHCHAVPWRVSLSKHAVVEEEGEGPKRPRRLRVREGAYKETETRVGRDPAEGRERKIRRCAMVPVGGETLRRMEET